VSAEPQAPALSERLLDVGQALLLLGVPAVGAWAVRRGSARRRRRLADAELAAATAEALRAVLDADRSILERLSAEPSDLVIDPEEWVGRCAVLRSRVDAARNRLWVALGYPDPRAEPGLTPEAKAVLAELSRTLRLKARDMGPEERAAWLEQQRVEMRRAAGLPADEGPLFKRSSNDPKTS